LIEQILINQATAEHLDEKGPVFIRQRGFRENNMQWPYIEKTGLVSIEQINVSRHHISPLEPLGEWKNTVRIIHLFDHAQQLTADCIYFGRGKNATNSNTDDPNDLDKVLSKLRIMAIGVEIKSPFTGKSRFAVKIVYNLH
jgi:hypothetical protein